MKLEIEINDEIIPTLERMIDEINTQYPRGTAMPLWEVRDYRPIVVDEDYDHDRIEYIDSENECETLDNDDLFEKFKEWVSEMEDNELKKEYNKYKSWDELTWQPKDDFFDEHEGINRIAVKDIEQTHGVFYTELEANNHISANKHHYKKPYTYVVCAWRNPEYKVIYALLDAFARSQGKKCEYHT